MSSNFFCFWLKGYLAAIEAEQTSLSKEHLDVILNSLEMAIRAIQNQGSQSERDFSSNR
jgi:hypothetical protein